MSVIGFSFPTPTRFGAGALRELPQHLARLGVRRPLVVTDAGLARTPAFGMLESVLGAPGRGRDWFVFDGVHPNPVEEDVRIPASIMREKGCDGVIAIGGGSPLDAGKAARLLAKNPWADLARFYDVPHDWSGLAPLVAIPTTAGTGSEVGRSSVITLDATRRKAVLFHPELLAKLVILDPELTVGLPPHLTAATGADALTHCIESFTCPAFHPMCDGIALEGIALVIDALPRAVRDGKDLDARGRMLVAAAMGAVAFQKDLGVVHSMAHPLSTLFGMHHGLANALCLVAGMRFCSARKPGLYRRVGVACGLAVDGLPDSDADAAVLRFIGEFLARIGLQGRLRDHGADPARIGDLVAQAVEDPCHRTNAVPVSESDFQALYLEVL